MISSDFNLVSLDNVGGGVCGGVCGADDTVAACLLLFDACFFCHASCSSFFNACLFDTYCFLLRLAWCWMLFNCLTLLFDNCCLLNACLFFDACLFNTCLFAAASAAVAAAASSAASASS